MATSRTRGSQSPPKDPKDHKPGDDGKVKRRGSRKRKRGDRPSSPEVGRPPPQRIRFGRNASPGRRARAEIDARIRVQAQAPNNRHPLIFLSIFANQGPGNPIQRGILAHLIDEDADNLRRTCRILRNPDVKHMADMMHTIRTSSSIISRDTPMVGPE